MDELSATTPQGISLTAEDEVYESLQSRIRGTILRRDQPGYDEARKVWNGMIDRYPAVIVRCTGTADVIAAVNFARDQGLPVAVRGGGHNVSGNAVCDDGVVIDLSLMRSVRVDPERRTVRVAGGARLGDVDHETQAAGMAVPLGLISKTGVAGLALHGGVGFLARRFGLTSDQLVAADVVTADGKLLLVNEESHPDLLWALKGGGGNFGVVTSFEFNMYPVGPEVWMGLVMYPLNSAAKVLDVYRNYVAQAPEALATGISLWTTPGEDPVPEHLRGLPIIAVLGCWSGPLDDGEQMFKPLRDIDEPLLDLSGPYPFAFIQSMFDRDNPDGGRYYWKSLFVKELTDEMIQLFIHYAVQRPSPKNEINILHIGGAMNRIDPRASAFYQRDAQFMIGMDACWKDPSTDEANMAWSRELYKELRPISGGSMYYNFPGFFEDGEDLLRETFRDNFERLCSVKARYDPGNLFQFNLRIPAPT